MTNKEDNENLCIFTSSGRSQTITINIKTFSPTFPLVQSSTAPPQLVITREGRAVVWLREDRWCFHAASDQTYTQGPRSSASLEWSAIEILHLGWCARSQTTGSSGGLTHEINSDFLGKKSHTTTTKKNHSVKSIQQVTGWFVFLFRWQI